MSCPHCTNGTVYLLTSSFPCDRCSRAVDSENQSRRYVNSEYVDPVLLTGTVLCNKTVVKFEDQNEFHSQLPHFLPHPPVFLACEPIGQDTIAAVEYPGTRLEICFRNCKPALARAYVLDSWFVDTDWYREIDGFAKHLQETFARLSAVKGYKRALKNQGSQTSSIKLPPDCSMTSKRDAVDQIACYLMAKTGDFRNQGRALAQFDNLAHVSVTYDRDFPARLEAQVMSDNKVRLLVETVQ